MEEIFIPVLHSFENGNAFSGSCGALRFYLRPEQPDGEDAAIKVEIWHGSLCYEKSEMEEVRRFPMTQDGIAEIRDYLMENRRNNHEQ
ncbi:MAG: hypothetical protein PHS97_02540 [Oscillospiraceae bacterium]|nr:hypothetical protein [Oscillospiraceae bacterium]